MANFCAKCGAALAGGAKFCAECGAAIGDPTGEVRTGSPGAAPIDARTGLSLPVASLLCYIATFLSGIVFLNLEPYRRDATIRFHAWQAILFGGGCVVLS